MTPQEALTKIQALDEVIEASLWNKVPGKERIYVKTRKHNGGYAWNGGVGYQTCYVDVNARKLVYNGEAGAATRKRLAETMDALTEIATAVELGR